MAQALNVEMLTTEQRRLFETLTAQHPMSAERQQLVAALLGWRRHYEDLLLRTVSGPDDHRLAGYLDSYLDADPDLDGDYSRDGRLDHLVRESRSWTERHVKADGSHNDWLDGIDRLVVDAVNAVGGAEGDGPVVARRDDRDAEIARLKSTTRHLFGWIAMLAAVLLLVLFGVIPTIR